MLQLGTKQKLLSSIHQQPQRTKDQSEPQPKEQHEPRDGSAPGVLNGRQDIRISGRQLLVNGTPFHIKGVNWNPVPRGERPPRGIQWQRFVQQDSSMMAAAGINVVRTYEPITDRGVLDVLWSRGIRVACTVYSYGGHDPWSVANHVNAVKDHPAVLMWVLGNEWNYNMLYKQSLSFGDAIGRVRDAARIVKQHDSSHPVATIYGELPADHVLRSLPEIDIWGMNVYNELSLGNIFSDWKHRSHLPMFLGEYGADAYDAHTHSVNEAAQAEATTTLTNDIVSHSSVSSQDNVCAGGFIFEWADEWWKDPRGSSHVHDVGGIAPGGGPYPDRTFNEEYWGLVHEDRRPRAAYNAYAAISVPNTTGAQGDYCDESTWPDKDHDLVCGDCKVLVNNFNTVYNGNCNSYCASIGRTCIGAWEESGDTCTVKYGMSCDQVLNSTSDAICQCSYATAVRPNATIVEPPVERRDPSHPPEIRVNGRQLLVDGTPIHLKGVNWNPVPRGQRPPRGLQFREYVDQDAKMMADIGINAVRTYEPITDTYVLDTFHKYGIWVANTVYSWGGSSPRRAAQIVNRVKNHPAILMWVIGNEWNYNMLYFDRLTHEDVYERLKVAARIIKQHDTTRPVATVYGSVPDPDVLRKLPDIDVWGMNVYQGITLGNIFTKWEGESELPMFLGEYGADAYNAHRHAEDERSQATATRKLTEEILAHSSATEPNSVCIGGFVFEWADEWWKDMRGSDHVQDVGGIAPGGGPYPDKTFNEEFWGLVREDRTPREAYHELGKISVPRL